MSRVLGTYKLRHAIIRETVDVHKQEHEEVLRPAGSEIILKRPRGKDLRIMDRFEGQEIAGSLALICRISNLDEEEVELLDGEDMGELGKLLGGSAPAGQMTGQNA